MLLDMFYIAEEHLHVRKFRVPCHDSLFRLLCQKSGGIISPEKDVYRKSVGEGELIKAGS